MVTSFATCLGPLSAVLAGFLPAGARASTFLQKGSLPALPDDTHFQLLEELEGALGQTHRQATEQRMARIRDTLRPTFAALPKDASGKLDRAVVRYVLHRFFVEKHGWYVRGLTPTGEAQGEFSPDLMLQGKVPESIFERPLGGNTFGLEELAVLAATLENLVHEESIKRLEDAYRANKIATKDRVHEEQFGKIIKTYLAMYLLKLNASSAVSVLWQEHKVNQAYSGWTATVHFEGEVRGEVFDRSDVDVSSITFDDAVRVAEEFNERYGRWQDRECRGIKHDLVKMDTQGQGRVLLKDFLTAGIPQFSEGADYLRHVGALDDSDPQRMKVIIPNYVNAPSNCVASSSFYSVCCIDECEALMGQVERSIAAPDAAPSRIAEVISTLPSATVEAPRSLPAALLGRLDEIAAHHGHGRVPIHGRLFSLFMHHAYPRECSFPHLSGTVRPLGVKEWRDTMGTPISATADEVDRHVANTAALVHDAEESLPWSTEEELFCTSPPVPASPAGTARTACRAAAFAALLSSASLALLRWARSAAADAAPDLSKIYV